MIIIVFIIVIIIISRSSIIISSSNSSSSIINFISIDNNWPLAAQSSRLTEQTVARITAEGIEL